MAQMTTYLSCMAELRSAMKAHLNGRHCRAFLLRHGPPVELWRTGAQSLDRPVKLGLADLGRIFAVDRDQAAQESLHALHLLLELRAIDPERRIVDGVAPCDRGGGAEGDQLVLGGTVHAATMRPRALRAAGRSIKSF